MIQRLFTMLFATALIVVIGCGRQVTPNPPGVENPGGGLQPGFMQVKFRTAQAMDFTNVRYWIAFNTSGTGTSPYVTFCNAQNNYRDCYFALIVGGNGATASAKLVQFVRQPGPNNTVAITPITLSGIAPQDLILNPNTNGQQTEFTVTFRRGLLKGLSLGSPAPSPSPTSAAQTAWFMNFYTTDTNNAPLDAAGPAGIGDTGQFTFSVDTTQNLDLQFFTPAGAPQAPSASAQIASGEVLNNP